MGFGKNRSVKMVHPVTRQEVPPPSTNRISRSSQATVYSGKNMSEHTFMSVSMAKQSVAGVLGAELGAWGFL